MSKCKNAPNLPWLLPKIHRYKAGGSSNVETS